MSLPEQVPPDGWTALRHVGEEIAQVRSEPSALAFRVPRERFDLDLTQQLTLEDLLTAAAVPCERVESWQLGDESYPGMGGTNPELRRLLPPPAPGATHLTVHVRLNPAAAGDEPDVAPEQWQALEAAWKSILALEVSIESMRVSVDGLRAEMEAEFRKPLALEDKMHALQADVAQWTKAKSRIHYAVPKAREFIHRATWAAGLPERQRLEEVFKTHIEPRVAFPQMDRVREQLEHLQKDRQVLLAQGTAVSQECRGILADVQRALSTLQRNAADRARKERSARREKGKYF